MEDLDMTNPEAVAAEYIRIASEIRDLEIRGKLLRDVLAGLVKPFDPTVPSESQKWRMGGAVVMWVKGRRVEKVDPKAIRKGLVLAGVGIEVIDRAYESATTVTVGSPTIRVVAEENANEAAEV